MNIKRRNFIQSGIFALLIPEFVNKSLANTIVKTKEKIYLKLIFENGEENFIYFDNNICTDNSMGHYKCCIITTYDLEPLFLGKSVEEVCDSPPIIEYSGYAQDGTLCYEGIVKEKLWISNV